MVVNRGVFAMVEMQRRCSHDWRCGAGRGGAAMSARKYCVWIKGGREMSGSRIARQITILKAWTAAPARMALFTAHTAEADWRRFNEFSSPARVERVLNPHKDRQ